MENNKGPLISIVVASYNYEQYIKENINSIINQTYTNFELIIIDDGSVDGSVEIIKDFAKKDPRIKFLQHENNANKGLAESLKLAISNANSEWIAFCESDDFWTPNHLQEKVEYINNFPNADIVLNRFKLLGDRQSLFESNNGFFTLFEKLKKLKKPEIIYYRILTTWTIPTFSVVIARKNALLSCNFEPPLKNGIDLWLWAQFLLRYKAGFVNKELTYWRKHGISNAVATMMNSDIDYASEIDKMMNLTSIQKLKCNLYKIAYKIRRVFWDDKLKDEYRIKKFCGIPFYKKLYYTEPIPD